MNANIDYTFTETLTKGKIYSYNDIQIYAKFQNQGPGSLRIVDEDSGLDETIASGSSWEGDTNFSELEVTPTGTATISVTTFTDQTSANNLKLASQMEDIATIVPPSNGADDTEAILKATIKGGSVLFPKGIYFFDGDLELDVKTTLYSNNREATITMLNGGNIIVNSDETMIKSLVVKSDTQLMSTTKAIITLNSKATVYDCEIDGMSLITDENIVAIGGHGIGLEIGS